MPRQQSILFRILSWWGAPYICVKIARQRRQCKSLLPVVAEASVPLLPTVVETSVPLLPTMADTSVSLLLPVVTETSVSLLSTVLAEISVLGPPTARYVCCSSILVQMWIRMLALNFLILLQSLFQPSALFFSWGMITLTSGPSFPGVLEQFGVRSDLARSKRLHAECWPCSPR